jgi:hypothetical protein
VYDATLLEIKIAGETASRRYANDLQTHALVNIDVLIRLENSYLRLQVRVRCQLASTVRHGRQILDRDVMFVASGRMSDEISVVACAPAGTLFESLQKWLRGTFFKRPEKILERLQINRYWALSNQLYDQATIMQKLAHIARLDVAQSTSPRRQEL